MNNKSFQSEKLPPGWNWVKLGEVIKEALPGFACGQRDPKGTIQIRMNNVDTFGNLTLDDFIRVPVDDELLKKYTLKENDVLFNNTNSVELVGKTAIFKNHSEPIVYSNHFTRIRPIENRLLPVYLAKWLLNQWQNKTFEKLCNRWVGQSAVKNEKLLNLYIPLPPLSEQKRIVKILKEKLSAVEKAKKAAEEKLQAANTLKQSYLNSVFKNNDSKTWGKTKLGKICNFVGGMQPPKYMFSTEKKLDYIRLLQIQDYKSDEFAVYIPENEAKRTCIESDVMIGRYGPPLFQILRGLSGAYNVALMKAVPNEQIISKSFLYYLLQDPDMQKKVIEKSQRSAGQSGIQSITLENMSVSIPSLETQYKTSGFLDSVFLLTTNLIKKVQAELDLINKLPQSYLKEAFEGNL